MHLHDSVDIIKNEGLNIYPAFMIDHDAFELAFAFHKFNDKLTDAVGMLYVREIAIYSTTKLAIELDSFHYYTQIKKKR